MANPPLNPPSQHPEDFDRLTAALLMDPQRENTLTMADALFGTGAAHCSESIVPESILPHNSILGPEEAVSPQSEQSFASSPLSFSASERDTSVPLGGDADSLSSWFPSPFLPSLLPAPVSDDDLMAHLQEFSLAPAPMPTSQATVVTPLTTSEGQQQKFNAACTNLRGMAANGLPPSAMLQYLNASQAGLDRVIPAEILLQGMAEFEQNQSCGPSSPSASSQASSTGRQRHARGPRAQYSNVAPYAIPAGPKLYQCDQCPLVFDRAFNLREHLKTHDPNCIKEFVCPLGYCHHASHRRADMHRHIKNVHIKKEVLTSEHKAQILAAYPAMRGDFTPLPKKRVARSQQPVLA